MDQNQNPLQPDMQGQQNYQYGSAQTDQNQVQQANQTNTYIPYGQGVPSTNQMFNSYDQEYQQPTYASAAVKKKVNPAVIIVPIAILAVAAIVIVLILLLSGKGGYKGAEEKYFSQMMGGLSSALSETEKVSSEPQSVTVSFEASNSQISDYIGISDITFTAETAVKGEDIYAHMSLAAGDDLFNGKFWFDSDSSKFLMVLPEISSIYLQASITADEDDTQESQVDPDEALQALGEVISETMETYFEVIGNTEIEGGQTLALDGESYTADKVKINLNKVQIAKVVKAFLENLKNNDKAMDILCTYYGDDREYVALGIDDTIKEMDEAIEENDEESEIAFRMTVWMMDGKIVGREIELFDNYGDSAGEYNFYEIPVSDGTVTYFEIPDEIKFVNYDKVSGEAHSGTLTISDGYDEIEVKYEDMAVTDQLFQGEARIVVTGSEAFEVAVELGSEGDTKTVLVSVPNVCKVTVTAEPSQLSYEDMPQLSAGEVAVIDSNEDLYEDEAFNQFLSDVMEFFFDFDLY